MTADLAPLNPRALVFGIGVLLLSCAAPAPPVAAQTSVGPAAPEAVARVRPVPTSYHASAFVRGGRLGIRVIDYWSKGSSMRAQTVIAGHPFVTIVRGDRYIAFDNLTGRGIEIRRSAKALAEDGSRVRPFAFEHEEVQRAGGEIVEELMLGGLPGEIWRVSGERSRRTVWAAKNDPRVPLRVETFDRASGETIELDYSNWAFDLGVDASFFETPPKVQIESYGYDEYVSKALEGKVRAIPVLYPDLLHGSQPTS